MDAFSMSVRGCVYALSCIDGPPVYIGSTENSLSQRINLHIQHAKGSTENNPVQEWLRKLQSYDDLTVTVVAALNPSLMNLNGVQVRKLEAAAIKYIATRVIVNAGIILCNVGHNPFRKYRGVIDKESEGVVFRLAERDFIVTPAEMLSPYQFRAEMTQGSRFHDTCESDSTYPCMRQTVSGGAK